MPFIRFRLTFVLTIFLFFIPAAAQEQAIAPHRSLTTAGQTSEDELVGDDTHSYRLILTAGEYARVELHADQARLRLELYADQQLLAVLSEADAPEVKRLDIVAERATNYELRITPERSQQTTAQYRLTLQDKHAATAADRERFALHQLATEVVRLYRQQEKSALQQAAAQGREAAARWLALGEPERAGRMFERAGRSLFLISQNDAAREAFQQAVTAFQAAGAKRAEASIWAYLAILHYARGDFQQMFAAYARAWTIWQTTRDEEGLRFTRLLQAYLHLAAGDTKQTEAVCRQLLAEVGTGRTDEWNRLYREDVLMVLGITLFLRGELRQALPYLEESLALARQTHNALIEGLVSWSIGMTWQRLGERHKALAIYKQTAALWERLGWGIGQMDVYTSLAALYENLGRKEEAHRTYQHAIATVAAPSPHKLSSALTALANLQHDAGELRAALTSVEQAIRILDGLQSGIPVDSLRAGFQTSEYAVYELRNDLLMHLHERQPTAGYDAAAFQASEASRARALLQLLSEKQLLPDKVDPTLTWRADDLRQQIAALTSEQVRLRPTAAATERAALTDKLSARLAELENVKFKIHEQSPHVAALTLPAPLTLREIQQQVLDRDTLLLQYELGKERSFLFAVSSQGLQTFVLPNGATIEPLARQVYETLARRRQPKNIATLQARQKWLQQNEQAYNQAATQLSQMILQPVAALLQQKRLLIVPDGALHYVPFAALPNPVVGGRWSVTGSKATAKRQLATDTTKQIAANRSLTTDHRPPLIVNHELLTLPSASTLAVLRREWAEHKPAPKTLMLFADPVFDGTDERLASLRQMPTPTPATLPERLRFFGAVETEGNFSFPRLPASRTEAQAILALVSATERQAALDFDANYQAVTQSELAQYRFLHFATHGLFDETHPELSGLLLSQVNRAGQSLNGYFTTLDAFQLKLSAELVVLSGCQTALGKEVKGEGLLGLTRGFMYAGARRVMASLWQVNDAATAELMQQFYQGMLGAKKLSPAAALRAAQISMRQTPRWQSPYYWAAFTLQGEW